MEDNRLPTETIRAVWVKWREWIDVVIERTQDVARSDSEHD
jgi:hypothetical protein